METGMSSRIFNITLHLIVFNCYCVVIDGFTIYNNIYYTEKYVQENVTENQLPKIILIEEHTRRLNTTDAKLGQINKYDYSKTEFNQQDDQPKEEYLTQVESTKPCTRVENVLKQYSPDTTAKLENNVIDKINVEINGTEDNWNITDVTTGYRDYWNEFKINEPVLEPKVTRLRKLHRRGINTMWLPMLTQYSYRTTVEPFITKIIPFTPTRTIHRYKWNRQGRTDEVWKILQYADEPTTQNILIPIDRSNFRWPWTATEPYRTMALTHYKPVVFHHTFQKPLQLYDPEILLKKIMDIYRSSAHGYTETDSSSTDVNTDSWPIITVTYGHRDSSQPRIRGKYNNYGWPASIDFTKMTLLTGLEKPITTEAGRRQIRFKLVRKNKEGDCFECGLNVTGIPTFPNCKKYMEVKCAEAQTSGKHFRGGCFHRWLDLGELYIEKGCRLWPPARGMSYASRRFKSLEQCLGGVDNGCTFTPLAVLTPFSKSISLWARYHVCVCRGNWCNKASKIKASLFLIILNVLFKS